MSTDDQSLARQRPLTSEHATERLGVLASAIELYLDKQTRTNTECDGYHQLMQDIKSGTVERVIVSEVSRIS